jgi:excisionase family DNA binding protein
MMRGSDADRRHLTVEDLAERLGVPVRTIYDWNMRGVGPRYLKIGRHARYRMSDVLEWEKSRAVPAGR